MSMTDIMSAMRLHLFAEAAFVLALAAFATVLVTVFRGDNRAAFERARFLPLEDEPRPRAVREGGSVAGRGEAGHE
jgi:cbb3-type cytochrome oxidase subunit 3